MESGLKVGKLRDVLLPIFGERGIGFLRQTYRSILAKYSPGAKRYCCACRQKSPRWAWRSFDQAGYWRQAEERYGYIVGKAYQDADVCPLCYAQGRQRLQILYLKRKTSLFLDARPQKLLFIAPEISFLQHFGPHIDVTKGDKFEEGYNTFLYPKDTQCMDVTALPFPDNTFDWVLCNHVLEHVEDDHRGMTEIFRVLKSGGEAILQVPIAIEQEKTYENSALNTEYERARHYGQIDHVRLYGKDYSERLSSAGFSLRLTDPCKDGTLSEKEEKEHIIDPLETIYHVVKP